MFAANTILIKNITRKVKAKLPMLNRHKLMIQYCLPCANFTIPQKAIKIQIHAKKSNKKYKKYKRRKSFLKLNFFLPGKRNTC